MKIIYISLMPLILVLFVSCSKNVVNNDKALYQKFLAKKAYEDLNREIP